MVKDNTFGFLLIVPALSLLVFLVIFPIGYVIYLSLHDFSSASLVWTGLNNYINILFADPQFWL